MTLQANQTQIQPSTNYLVPSSGGTHIVPLSGVLSAAAAVIDWQQFSEESFAFQPQGVYIDNSAGIAPVVLQILAGGTQGTAIWTVTCPTGKVLHTPFPAPNGRVHKITGNGQVSIVYADFPVLPYGPV